MSLTKVTYSMISNSSFNVRDYGAKGDGINDDTAAIQAAIDAAQLVTGSTYITATHPCTVYVPAGVYKITATLNFLGNIQFIGDGNNATIFNVVSATPIQSFLIGFSTDNQYIWGSRFQGFRINCSGGAGVCDGIKTRTGAVNSVISQTIFDDILIWQCRTGFELTGVMYMNDWRNCRVISPSAYGFLAVDAKENIYNSYTNIEVTNVASTAWAYYMTQNAAAQFTNITADGCCYFGGAYTGIRGLAVEGISAASAVSNTCVTFNQISSASDIAIINVPNSKCSLGINVIGNVDIRGVRFPDAGAGNQPNSPIYFGINTKSLLTSVQMVNCVNKLDSGTGGLGGVTAIGCSDITVSGADYSEGTWTPGFATWTAVPNVGAARYIKHGRLVTIFLNFYDGSCVDSSSITGLPFAAVSDLGGTATMTSNEPLKRFTASIIGTGTSIINIPAQSLSGVFCQMTATYFAAS